MPRGKFRGSTSYGTSFHPKTVSPVQEFRCVTEMSCPTGDMDFMTTTRQVPAHAYGRPPIFKPADNDILNDDGDEGYSSGSRASTSLSTLNYHLPSGTRGINDHRTGYEWMSRSVESTMKWPDTERHLTTTNTVMYPPRDVTRYRKVDRNDFVKYVDFGFDTPVHVSVYGADFKELQKKHASPVLRKSSTISLERSKGPQETETTYGSQFKGEKGSPRLPTLSEMDAHLRSSIEFK